MTSILTVNPVTGEPNGASALINPATGLPFDDTTGVPVRIMSNGNIIEDNIRNWIRTGQAFMAGINKTVGGSAAGNYGLSLFNPSNSGKSILIVSMKAWNGSGTTVFSLQATTNDPALANTFTPQPLKLGGTASVLTSSVTYNSTAGVAVPGTFMEAVNIQNSQTYELLQNGINILLPSGTANGVALFNFGPNSANYGMSLKWIEF